MEQININPSWQGDAIILFRATAEELFQYTKQNRPVVLISSEGSSMHFPRVTPDNIQAGNLAAKHLLESLVPNLAYLARGETLYQQQEMISGHRVYSRERLKGFKDELQKWNRKPSVHYVAGHPLWEKDAWKHIEQEITKFLESLTYPCGLFVADDPLAAVVIKVANKIGIKIPTQLLIVGFGNDLNYCLTANPPLSSIVYPGESIGELAIQLIEQQISGLRLTDQHHSIPVEKLFSRRSSDNISIPDPIISMLIRWMRTTAPHRALRVTDLVDKSGLSSSTLKTRFQLFLGHSPKQEITLIRNNHFKHLLLHTPLPISEIANQMDFANSQEASRFFVRENQKPPSQFRNDQ